MTNRSIFIATNSPNNLQKLDLVGIDYCSTINLQNYPSIKSLLINIKYFNTLKSSHNNGFSACVF